MNWKKRTSFQILPLSNKLFSNVNTLCSLFDEVQVYSGNNRIETFCEISLLMKSKLFCFNYNGRVCPGK